MKMSSSCRGNVFASALLIVCSRSPLRLLMRIFGNCNFSLALAIFVNTLARARANKRDYYIPLSRKLEHFIVMSTWEMCAPRFFPPKKTLWNDLISRLCAFNMWWGHLFLEFSWKWKTEFFMRCISCGNCQIESQFSIKHALHSCYAHWLLTRLPSRHHSGDWIFGNDMCN